MYSRSVSFLCTPLTFLTFSLVFGAGAIQGAAAASSSTVWRHNGSTVYLVTNGSSREFYYQEPSESMRAAGAGEGALLFRGRSVNARYVGTAYIFSRRCGPVPYQVAGPILDNYERVVLQGQAPRLGPDCKPQSFFADALEFKLVVPTSGDSSDTQLSLPKAFVGVWQAGPDRNGCRAVTWDTRDQVTVQMIKTAAQSLMGWEFACKISSLKRPQADVRQDKESVVVELSCGGEGGLTWNSTEIWTLLATGGRKGLIMTQLKVSDVRDSNGRPTREIGLSNKTPVEYQECD